mgnify:CR=1 FL=1|jgi:hypothetical protein
MTPRERRETANRAATRGPIYEGIGFGVITLVAILIGGPIGLAFMVVVGAVLLGLGLIVGIIRGPAKPPTTPGGIPPAG